MTTRKALAIRHVAFEDLGSFAGPLERAGYAVIYHDSPGGDLSIDPREPDLVIMLGGPVGAYDGALYPFLRAEAAFLERRLAADRPTLGVCLGAQVMAQVLGSRVYPAASKEIGWAPVVLTPSGQEGPLARLRSAAVLHWHGDTFDLPDGCDLLASTAACPHQAFSRGPRVLALQFHAEVRGEGFEHWLVGHASELATAGLDPCTLRREAVELAGTLELVAAPMMSEWLRGFA